MKKIFKNKFLIFILGGMIFSCASVCATTLYHAKQVSYNDNNVETALNDLYNLSKNSGTYNEIIITLDGLAHGVEYYVNNGRDTNDATSGSVISIKKTGATVKNTSSYGNIIYSVGLGRYYVKPNGLNIYEIYAKKVLSNTSTENFNFDKIVLNITLTATITDTYTSSGSVSNSITGNITIHSDGTYEKDNFNGGYSGTLYNNDLARYQSSASIKINSCTIT